MIQNSIYELSWLFISISLFSLSDLFSELFIKNKMYKALYYVSLFMLGYILYVSSN